MMELHQQQFLDSVLHNYYFFQIFPQTAKPQKMQEQLYPLFGSAWTPNVPTDLKEIFYSNNSDGETSNSRKQSYTYESIIVDEEYEILQGDIQKCSLSLCPLCYATIDIPEVQIYSCTLQQYYNVHNHCALLYKQKTAKFHNFGEEVLRAQKVDKLTMTHDLTSLEDVKVFIQFSVFHPISQKALICLNHTTCLRQQKNNSTAFITHDYGLKEHSLYQPKKIYIPLLEARCEVEVNILDSNLILEGKSNWKWVFYYDLNDNKQEVTLQINELRLCLQVGEKSNAQLQKETGFEMDGCEYSKVVNLRFLMIRIEDILKLIKQKQMTPQRSPDSFLFSPKMSVHAKTPQISASPSRVRFQSFQLEENNSNNSTLIADEWTEDLKGLEQIRGNIVNFVKTQHGSRLIQKYFTTCSQGELDQLLNEIGPHLAELMVDPYANYMFGSLSQSCAPNQRFFIFQTIQNRLVEIACDKKGTHAIQSLVSLINSRQEEDIVENSIKNNVTLLALDSQGTHLIRKIIARFAEEKLAVLFSKLMERFLPVVNHQFGLCVLKDLISKFKNNSERAQTIVQKMRDSLDEIVQDPYGNYAIQHAIDIFGDQKCTQIIDRILQKLIQLSIHKYSSNVVEKCILETSYKVQRKFIKQLSVDATTLELMKNKFGTFVLQKALQEAEKQHNLRTEYEALLASLSRNVQQIYALSIKQKWTEYLARKQ